MFYRIMADLMVVVHFGWICFMLLGFALTVRAFRKPAFFDRWLFRTIHLAGIFFVAILEIFGKYCPLTLWENALRRHYDPSHEYPGSFIAQYILKLIYPDVDLAVIIIPTILIALFTIVVFILRPPEKFRFLQPFRRMQ